MYPNGLLKSAIFSKYETGCLDTPADMLYEFHNVVRNCQHLVLIDHLCVNQDLLCYSRRNRVYSLTEG